MRFERLQQITVALAIGLMTVGGASELWAQGRGGGGGARGGGGALGGGGGRSSGGGGGRSGGGGPMGGMSRSGGGSSMRSASPSMRMAAPSTRMAAPSTRSGPSLSSPGPLQNRVAPAPQPRVANRPTTPNLNQNQIDRSGGATGPLRDQAVDRDHHRDNVGDNRDGRDGRDGHDGHNRNGNNQRFGRYFFRPGFGWWYWAWNPGLGRYYQYYDRSYTGGGYNYPAYAYETEPSMPQAALGVTFNPNLSGGAYITQVVPGGAAEQAGIQPGDVIVAINGGPVTSYLEVIDLVGQSRPGDPMQIELLRGGQRFVVNAILTEQFRK